MTKVQQKRTAMVSMFQNDISQSTKCSVRDGFHRDSHNYSFCLGLLLFKLQPCIQRHVYKANFLAYAISVHSVLNQFTGSCGLKG